MTKEEVLAAVRECLYGSCKGCPFFDSILFNGSRCVCRLKLLSEVEDVLTKDKNDDWLPEPYHDELVM